MQGLLPGAPPWWTSGGLHRVSQRLNFLLHFPGEAGVLCHVFGPLVELGSGVAPEEDSVAWVLGPQPQPVGLG